LITFVVSKGLDKIWNITKTNIRENMVEIGKDFILDTKRDGFYPKNRLRRKLWKK
jgi:hypothetical protein